MDKTVAFDNLTTLTSLLNERGMRAWLDGGTLLGCYRGGDLIDYDADTDLGMNIADWQREPALDFLHAAKAAGFRVARYFGDVSLGLEICLQRGGVHTDLFFYYPEADRVWCGAWTGWYGLRPGQPKVCRLIKYSYERFDLRSLRVKGLDFHVPADTERFLVTLYGETWRTPDPSWNGMGSPPNAVLTDFVVERDPTVFVEEEFFERALPRGTGAGPPVAGPEIAGIGMPLQNALHRARARRRARPPASYVKFCHRGTLRCEDNPGSRHYRYSAYGADTPLCCASHLVEALFAVTTLFEAHDIPYFILWGTHLGAVRHRGLIPWDTDVDMGIFAEDYPRARRLRPLLAAQGFRLRDAPEQRLFTLDYGATNKLHVDIEVWHREAAAVVWDKYTIAESDMFPLRKYPFYHRELWGPRALTYLLDYYGDDCLEYGRKQWVGWGTRLWKPGRARRFDLADREPAAIDLSRDYAAESGDGGPWERARVLLARRAGWWKVRAYWAKLGG